MEENKKIKKYSKEQIIEKLIKKNYVGKLLTYNELHSIYLEYGNCMTERNFAFEILEISYYNYRKCKNDGTGIKILKNMKMTEQEKDELLRQFIKKGYAGKLITYEELQELHQEYCPNISEREFALEILEVSYCNYYHFKTTKSKVKILKSAIRTKDEVDIFAAKLKNEKTMKALIKRIDNNIKGRGKLREEEINSLFKYYIKLGAMNVTLQEVNTLKNIILYIPSFATPENMNLVLTVLTRLEKHQEAIKLINEVSSDENIKKDKRQLQKLQAAKIEIQRNMRERAAIELFKYNRWYNDDDIAKITGLTTIEVIRLKKRYKEQETNSKSEETR